MIEPKVNLGQSQFQDTFFVAGAELTPYRRLRQIELELRSIEDALKRGSIAQRRLELKVSKLDPKVPEQALDIEEAEWDLQQQLQLIADAEGRKSNFLEMKRQLLQNVPQEYWDIGYENAELDHWVAHFSQQLALMRIAGQPNLQLMQQICLLPETAQHQVMQLTESKVLALAGPSVEAEVIEPSNRSNL